MAQNTAPALPELDDLDRRILEQLQIDCALTNQDLAERVHASPPTCLRRVRRLVDIGVIDRQVAILAADKLGSTLTAIVEITLDVQAAESLDAFEQSMLAEPAVLQCYRVSPGPDFVVIAQVRDMPAYHALVHRAFTAQANVRNVRTFFSVHRAKFERGSRCASSGVEIAVRGWLCGNPESRVSFTPKDNGHAPRRQRPRRSALEPHNAQVSRSISRHDRRSPQCTIWAPGQSERYRYGSTLRQLCVPPDR